MSVESVVESLVSRYEHHFSSSRQPLEDHALNEMLIAENGPLDADRILEKSMDKYWKEYLELFKSYCRYSIIYRKCQQGCWETFERKIKALFYVKFYVNIL